MSVADLIQNRLTRDLAPVHLEVVDESHMHNVPAGAESHFKVVVVSERFRDQRKVARHRQVYALLSEQLAGPVHALALHTYSPEEWQERAAAAPESPDCLGGGRHDRA